MLIAWWKNPPRWIVSEYLKIPIMRTLKMKTILHTLWVGRVLGGCQRTRLKALAFSYAE